MLCGHHTLPSKALARWPAQCTTCNHWAPAKPWHLAALGREPALHSLISDEDSRTHLRSTAHLHAHVCTQQVRYAAAVSVHKAASQPLASPFARTPGRTGRQCILPKGSEGSGPRRGGRSVLGIPCGSALFGVIKGSCDGAGTCSTHRPSVSLKTVPSKPSSCSWPHTLAKHNLNTGPCWGHVLCCPQPS